MRRTGDSTLSAASGSKRRTVTRRRAHTPTEPAGRPTHRENAAACLLCVLACLLISGILVMSSDCASADDSADILPPVISIVSPRPGADLYSPRSVTIEVEYTDPGVDPATAYLFVNDADATSELTPRKRATLTLTGLRQGTIRSGLRIGPGWKQKRGCMDLQVHGVLEAVSQAPAISG